MYLSSFVAHVDISQSETLNLTADKIIDPSRKISLNPYNPSKTTGGGSSGGTAGSIASGVGFLL